MSFRLINNRAQDIGVKAFVVTIVLSIVLQLFGVLSIIVTLPFTLPSIMIWLIGYGMIDKSGNKEE